ncbi:hypothetical protein K3495_g9080 [Podosphaera aphanis]|nr:hypothetical protein K3495_g9080 [Podosphaera aphanis]
MYRETVLLQLECIGYESGVTLTPLDEVRFAAVIQRTTTAEVASLVIGMKRGTEMMRLFDRTYRQSGEIQQEAVWGTLLDLKYTGGCPVEYVTKFKTSVRDYLSTGGTLVEKQISVIFKQSTKEKAGKWNAMVSTIARFQSWSAENLIQDFISHHFDRIEQSGKSDKPRANEMAQKFINNAQGEECMKDNRKTEGKAKGNNSRKKFPFRCYNCKEKGHTAKNCLEKRKSQAYNTQVAHDRSSSEIGPPPAIAEEYCQIPREDLAGSNYTAQVDPDVYNNMVSYENEMSRRRGEASIEKELPESEAPGACVQFTQQILSASGENGVENRWLFDTGADVDATNRRQNFKPGIVVELKPKQFPIQTGSVVVCAECVGEVWLSLTGPGGAQTSMRLKYVVYLKVFPLNIVSGERFYRSGGHLNGNMIVSPNGEVLTHINAERRGFFLWLFNQPEPLKLLSPRKAVNVTSMDNFDSS